MDESTKFLWQFFQVRKLFVRLPEDLQMKKIPGWWLGNPSEKY